MPERLAIRKAESIQDELKHAESAIGQRAAEIALENPHNGHSADSDLANWLQAERELFWKPAVELEEQNEEYLLQLAMPGVHPKDIRIDVTPEDVLVRAELHHEHRQERGSVILCEFPSGNLFRAVSLPKRIDPGKITADFRYGTLRMHARIAQAEPVKKKPLARAASARTVMA